MHRFSEAARRIGGPYSVTWFAYWVTLALNILHHFLGSADLHGQYLPRLLSVLASQAAMFAVLLLAKVTLLRNTAVTPRPVLTLVVFALAGLGRSVVLVAVLSEVLEPAWSQVFPRLFTGPLPFMAYLAVCAYLVDLYQQNKRILAGSAMNQADLVAARTHAEEAVRSQGGEALEEVRCELLRRLDTTAAPEVTAEELDAFVDNTVRPLSHRLAARVKRWSPPPSPPVNPSLSPRRLFASVGLDGPFSPAVQAGLCLAPAISLITVVPFSRFLLVIAVTVLTPFSMLTLGNRLLRALTPQMSLTARTSAVAGWTLVSAAVVASSWGLSLLGTPYVATAIAFGMFETALLAAATVTAKTALTAQRTLEADLAASSQQLRCEIARVHQVQWHQQRQLARALHGPLVSALVQLAARDDVDGVRDRVIEILDQSLATQSTPTDLTELVGAVQRSWHLVCEVKGEVLAGTTAAAGQAPALACLADILHEAVNNAVRHGDARHVDIVIAPRPNAVSVTVLDDGAHALTDEHRGLGSRMLDDCCLGWNLSRTAAGTRLWFLLPLVLGARANPAVEATHP